MARGWLKAALVAGALLSGTAALAENPIVPGWYADPEIRVFGDRYWIYPTYSDHGETPDVSPRFNEQQQRLREQETVRPSYYFQTFLNAFSSPDLVNWTKHSHVLDVENVDWAAYAVWAPSAIEKDGRYYLFFGANDIQSDDQLGGIGVAVSDSPAGPFRDAIGKPLIDAFHNGAQPIDQFVFRDRDGQHYLYYGGWQHCNVARLGDDLISLEPFADGTMFKEITPEGYVEGSFMVERDGIYYLMWSEGGWTGPDYRVAYAMGPSPTGPFERKGTILSQDFDIARGAGHHSVMNVPGTYEWYIAYHRRPLDETSGERRQIAIDRMYFDNKGEIRPVVMTNEGVDPRPLPDGGSRNQTRDGGK